MTENTMQEVFIYGLTKGMGCCVQTTVKVPRDYTMQQMVEAVKNAGYAEFWIPNTPMKKFVKVQ